MIVQSLEEEKGRKSVSREVDVEVDGWEVETTRRLSKASTARGGKYNASKGRGGSAQAGSNIIKPFCCHSRSGMPIHDQ